MIPWFWNLSSTFSSSLLTSMGHQTFSTFLLLRVLFRIPALFTNHFLNLFHLWPHASKSAAFWYPLYHPAFPSPFSTSFIHSWITPICRIFGVFQLGCRLQDLPFHSVQLLVEKMLISKGLVITGAFLWQSMMGNKVLLPWHKGTVFSMLQSPWVIHLLPAAAQSECWKTPSLPCWSLNSLSLAKPKCRKGHRMHFKGRVRPIPGLQPSLSEPTGNDWLLNLHQIASDWHCPHLSKGCAGGLHWKWSALSYKSI